MSIQLVVAMSENRVIGVNNQLPWHLPNDLKHFKEVTMGKPIVMGRKTFESIGKALPGRTNIILTKNSDFKATGCTVVHALDNILSLAEKSDSLMIIGGAKIYEQMLPFADTLYVTLVHTKLEGDAYFPNIDAQRWEEAESEYHESDEKHDFSYTFKKLILKV